MRALYHHDGPDGEPLTHGSASPVRHGGRGTGPGGDRAAVAALAAPPEKIREIELARRRRSGLRRRFYDYTLSAEKSVSLLHAGHMAAAKRARAERRPQIAARHEAAARLDRAGVDRDGARAGRADGANRDRTHRPYGATTGQWRRHTGRPGGRQLPGRTPTATGAASLHVQMTILEPGAARGRSRMTRGARSARHYGPRSWGPRRSVRGSLAQKTAAAFRWCSGQRVRLRCRRRHAGDDGRVQHANRRGKPALRRVARRVRAAVRARSGPARAVHAAQNGATIETRKAKREAARDAEHELGESDPPRGRPERPGPRATAGGRDRVRRGAPAGRRRGRSDAERIRIAVHEVQRQNAATWTRSRLC